MKKLVLILFGFTLMLLLFSACKATKGCGLTSDAQKIEQSTISEPIVVTTAE